MLSSILEEIVSCRDVIAQEYLMDVVIQVFQDEFHFQTLEMFLQATAQLHVNVNVKNIVIALIDRFTSYAIRTREEAESKNDASDDVISKNLLLFDIFWDQIKGKIKCLQLALLDSRPEFTIQDIASLLLSVLNLSLSCYPGQIGQVDKVLGLAKTKFETALKGSYP